MSWESVQATVLRTRMGRSLADAIFRQSVRRRLTRLDQLSPARSQYRTLRRLVHRARRTRFGLEHDFQRIRTENDFRRLVPLTSPHDLWRQFSLPALPVLEDVLWPGPVSFLATCETPIQELNSPLTVTPDLGRVHREAFLTALALIQQQRPHARLLSGTLLLLGGGASLTPTQTRSARYSMENLVLRQLPSVLRPFTVIAPQSGNASLDSLSKKMIKESVTCIVTSVGRLLRLWGYLQKQSEANSLLELWPDLTAIVYARTGNPSERIHLQRLLGNHPRASSVLLLESVIHPQGVIAVEDPRYGRLRMLTHHGIYFDLLPIHPSKSTTLQRTGLAEAEPHVPYRLAMSSPAGLWSCLLGVNITFSSMNPPLIESLEMGQPVVPPLHHGKHARIIQEVNSQEPHPPHESIPARPPERLSRSPWSGPLDQK